MATSKRQLDSKTPAEPKTATSKKKPVAKKPAAKNQ